MRMYQVEVRVTDGDILISQDDALGEFNPSVIISSDQVDLLIEWLMKAKEESNAAR